MQTHRLIATLALSSAAVPAQAALASQVFASGLSRPVQVAAPSGDLERVFVVEQTGAVRVFRAGQLLAQPFLDVTQATAPPMLSFGERGLLGIAFHPDFDSNGHVYVYCLRQPGITAVVERYTTSSGNPDACDPASRIEVWSTAMIYGNHNGGGIAFGPDGMLYVPVGDGGSTPPNWPSDPFNNAQRGDTMLGKVLRLDVDQATAGSAYAVPADNPFVSDPLVLDEIWALGLRNPYRCSFDRLTGDYWIADVGGVREELNLEPAGFAGGRNYGWSCMSGTHCNNLPVCSCSAPALTLPLHDYNPVGSQAVIGGYVYRGCAIPALRGSYVFADYMTGQVWSLQHNGQNVTQLLDRTAELTPPGPSLLASPTGFGEDGYGELYLCTLSGDVLKLVPAAPAVAGVTPFGAGTPGCAGPHVLTATCAPVVGAQGFALACSNAPPSALGLVAFSDTADVAGSDPLGVGLTVHVGIGGGYPVIAGVTSDSVGAAIYALPIPPAPALTGTQLHGQAVWAWGPGACQPSALGWSSSSGLSFTIQP